VRHKAAACVLRCVKTLVGCNSVIKSLIPKWGNKFSSIKNSKQIFVIILWEKFNLKLLLWAGRTSCNVLCCRALEAFD